MDREKTLHTTGRNRRRARLFMASLLAALSLVGSVRSGETDAYAQVMRRFDMLNAELEKTVRELDRPPSVPEYPARLLSLEKNASVTIGGELRVDYVGVRSNIVDPSFGPTSPGLSLSGRGRLANLSVTEARLTVDARIARRWRAFFDIGLQGESGLYHHSRLSNPNGPGIPVTAVYPSRNRINLLREASLELLKNGHSGFGLKVGLFKPQFGLAGRPDLVAKSFLDAPNLSGSSLMAPVGWDANVLLPHAARLREPVLGVMAGYELRDIIRFEAALYQDRDGSRFGDFDFYEGPGRRNDYPMPRSWQVGMSILPLEGWELSATFRNRYNGDRGLRDWADSPYRWDFRDNAATGGGDPFWDPATGQWSDSGTGPAFGSRKNEQALAVGLAVEIPNTALSVRLEYAHGWNQGFNRHIRSDDVSLGLSYRLTPALTLHGQGEWLHVKDGSWMVRDAAGAWARDARNNRLYRLLLGAEYEIFRGLSVEAGWQYEYWNAISALGGNGTREERINQTNMFYLGSRFIF